MHLCIQLLLKLADRTAAGAPGICWHREEGGGDASPEAAAAVHSEGIEWVVDL